MLFTIVSSLSNNGQLLQKLIIPSYSKVQSSYIMLVAITMYNNFFQSIFRMLFSYWTTSKTNSTLTQWEVIAAKFSEWQHIGDEWSPFWDKAPEYTTDICRIISPEFDDDKKPQVGTEGKLQRSQKLRFVIAAVTAEASVTGSTTEQYSPTLS